MILIVHIELCSICGNEEKRAL